MLSYLDKKAGASQYWAGVAVAGNQITNDLDKLTGRGIFRIMRSAYTFINANYLPEDRIYIFGFSRGAYTARHLAAMIVRYGLDDVAESVYDRYRADLMANKSFSTVQQAVHFLGLFDCVPGNQLYLSRNPNSKILNDPLLENGIIHFRTQYHMMRNENFSSLSCSKIRASRRSIRFGCPAATLI
jgi:uncharacterized protein (DUF2235 family)